MNCGEEEEPLPIRGMGRVGQALKQALGTYGISQNKLAMALGIERTIVNRWFHERASEFYNY